MIRMTAVFLLLVPAVAVAQAERYELGLRLKAFEQAWEKQTDPAVRKRALEILPKVTTQFFAFQFGDAGRTLDEARWRLQGPRRPSASVLWAESLSVIPDKWLQDASAKETNITFKPFYKVELLNPVEATAHFTLNGKPIRKTTLGTLPQVFSIPLQEPGDAKIKITVHAGDVVVMERELTISRVPDLSKCLAEFKMDLPKVDGEKRNTRSATYRDYVSVLESLADGDMPETQQPAKDMFLYCQQVRKNALAESIPDTFQSLPLGKTKTLPYRLFVPKPVPNKPTPLVVALHGAGGTENLFFEGYGDGQAIKECQQRGWMLVSPRGGINFNSGPPVKALVEALAKEYPIDTKRIFVVGHSMGAAQTIALCQEHPHFFAAAAALGGGGRVKDAKAFDRLPIFIGIGAKDFARTGAKSLHKSLVDGGAKPVTYKEYPDIEHLVIVREALPDGFAMFDTVSKTVQQSK